MRTAFFCFLLLLFYTAFPQTRSKVDYPRVISPSPEAAALGKYGNIPVALFAGLPQISLPIYSFKNGSIDMSVSLNYDAGGIRVDQVATNVGLGWSLNAGGVITRSVLGVADGLNPPPFFPGNSFNPVQTTPLEFGTNADYLYARQLVNENKDLERDIYYYNFSGYTGRLVFDWSGIPRLIPANPDIKIESLGNGFKITDDKGLKYYFTIVEQCIGLSESCTQGAASPRETDVCFPTAWYLSRIESPDNRNVLFEYENYTYDLIKGYSETEYRRQQLNECPDLSYLDRKCTAKQRMSGVRIKRILASNKVKIDFNYSITTRADLIDLGQPAGNYLDNIKIYADNDLKKTWYLTYGYFSYPAAPRLKLLTVKEDDLPPHQFYYNETYNLPAKLSFSQDHWGFYNGKNNISFIPAVPLFGKTSGADKSPDFNYMKSGTLSKIEYPTGGNSEFEYEPHTDLITEDTVSVHHRDTGVNLVAWTGLDIANTIFYLESGSADISIDWQFINSNPDEKMNAFIIDNSTNQTVLTIDNPSGSMNLTGFLQTGREYTLRITRPTSGDRGHLNIQWTAVITHHVTYNKIVIGGLRIKSIKSYSSTGQPSLERYYDYNWLNDPARSSIIPQNFIKEYRSYYETYKSSTPEAGGCGYDVFASSSTPEFGNGLDNTIGYRQVVERTSTGNSNGRTIYKYSATSADVGISFGVTGQTSGFQGLLLEQIDQKYDAATNNFINVHKKRNTYATPYGQWCYLNKDSCAANQTVIPNMQISFAKPELQVSTDAGVLTYPASFAIRQYFTVTGLTSLKKTEEVLFSPNATDSIVTSSSYFYSNTAHKNPTMEEKVDSRGQLLRKEIKYAYDFAAARGNPPNIYNEMTTANMVLLPIEEKQTNVTGGNTELSKTQTLYKKWNNRTIQPQQILSSEWGASLEPDITFTSYDTSGNIVGYTGRNGETVSFLWDYNNSYPIVKAINTDSNSIAYTSFEADGKGNFSFSGTPQVDATAFTGKKVYNFTGLNSLTKSGLNSSTIYIVSYWTKNTNAFTITGTQAGYPVAGSTVNGWRYFEHKVTGQTQITIGGSGLIDEVRLYPLGAQMMTYTYDPLIGMTTQSDARSFVTYYIYDHIGRLILVKDQNGNNLKKNSYNYTGQSE